MISASASAALSRWVGGGGGCRGTTDVLMIFLQQSLSSASLRVLARGSSVHSLMLSCQHFFGLPRLLPLGTVPCMMVFDVDKSPRRKWEWNPGSAALEADTLTTGPTRQSLTRKCLLYEHNLIMTYSSIQIIMMKRFVAHGTPLSPSLSLSPRSLSFCLLPSTASLAWLRCLPRERKIPGSNPTCDRIFSRSSYH